MIDFPYRHFILWLAVGWLSGGAESLSGQDAGWVTFERCPVMVEHRVEVPAQERGFLKTLAVELNQTIAADQMLAELDTDLAELELQMAQLEQARAVELAGDESDIKFQQIALQQVEEELANHRSISNSVSESEIRRLTLGVEQAKLALARATHAHSRALNEVKIKTAAVEVAQLRLSRRRIIAPRSGVVTAIKAHPGQSLEAGQTILEIESLEQLVIDRLIPIAEFSVAELVGCEVRVDIEKVDGVMLRLAGHVTSYDPHVSSSGFVRVHARVKNIQQEGNWVLLPGREVTLHVAKGSRSSSQAKASVLPDRKFQ